MSLISFVSIEFNKVKGNRTFLITVIGALILPIIYSLVQIFIGGQEIISSLEIVYAFQLSLFSLVFAAVIINHLFTIDLETHTLKSIIPIPVSRMEYIIGKLTTLLIWMIGLAIITIVACFILFTITGMSGFELMPMLKSSGSYLLGTILLFLLMIPIATIVVFTNNTSAGLVTSVLLIFLNITPIESLKYNPWSFPEKIAFPNPNIPPDVNTTLAIVIIIVIAIVSYLLLKYVFYNRDIYL